MTIKNNFRMVTSLLLLFLMGACKDANQEEAELSFNKTSVYKTLLAIENLEDSSKQQSAAAEFWEGLIDTASIPYVKEDTAIFFYNGTANQVAWNGDFNSWGGDNNFLNKGTQIGNTNLWYLLKTFPANARLDYKITINNTNWILDPNNPFQQWSGFGPNSELRMPEWKEETIGRNRGNEVANIEQFEQLSTSLSYNVAYKVFLPNNYASLSNLPVLYVTDGHEYEDSRLGNIINITQNLIDDKLIDPIVIVLIDPRNPANENQNRRQEEYTISTKYLSFVTEELIPLINDKYKTNSQAQGILGTSLGGLNSSYFGAEIPESFAYVAVQSPAYWYKPEIFDRVSSSKEVKQKIFLSAGTFNDGLANALRMKDIYKVNGHEVTFLEVNEGHSWGAWTKQLDNILIYFFGS